MNKEHRTFIERAPRCGLRGPLGLNLRVAAALRAGGAVSALSLAPLVLGPATQAKAQDTTPPQIAITTPINNAYSTTLPTITGTASDTGITATGVRDVKVGIFNDTTKRWWNGTAFASADLVELNAPYSDATGTWSYSAAPTNSPLQDGLYVVLAFATDKGGARDPNGAQVLAYVDNTAPNIITFEQPAPGAQVASLGSINGRAFDTTNGSGVNRVQLTIQRPDGQFWNGSTYQSASFRFTTDLAGSFWSTSSGPSAPADLPDGNYLLTAYARDAVGNEGSSTQITRVQQPPTPVPPDTTAPVVSLDTPVDNTFAKALTNPTGTVSDTGSSGLKQVAVEFFSDSTQKWWDGTSFSAPAPLNQSNTTITNGAWTYTGTLPAGAALPDGLYVVIAFGDDKAGNRGRDQSVVTIDNAKPIQLTFEQPTPGATTTSLVDISGRVADNRGGSGVAAVQVTIQRPDGQFWNGASYQTAPVRLDTSLGGGFWSLKTTLAAGANLPAGAYMLNAYAQDALGNEATAFQSTLITQTDRVAHR